MLTNIQIRGHIIIPILYADKHIFNFDDKHIFNFDDKHTSIRIACIIYSIDLLHVTDAMGLGDTVSLVFDNSSLRFRCS